MRSYGVLTGPAIGFILKEAVRRAITVIRAQRLIFDAQVKLNEYKPEKDDFVTSADRAAQEVYVRVFREAFPDFGIIAEEDHLHVEPTGPESVKILTCHAAKGLEFRYVFVANLVDR